MNKRPLGQTGLSVSELGLGAWQLANPDWGVSDVAEAEAVVAQALEFGCTFFDTAPGYGAGRSETLLGRALKSVREQVTLCSKFGHSPEGGTDFSVEALRPSLEASLRRLQTDYLDVLLLHNPPPELLDGRTAPHYEVLERLKTEGLVRAYGVSADTSSDLKTVIETTESGVLEVLFNVFHQEPKAAFALAQARGVGLIVKVPLDSGWLSGKYGPDSQFSGVRERWSPEVIARRAGLVRQVAALLPSGTPVAHGALQFVLAHPEVSTVIAGAKTAAQVQDNSAAAEAALTEGVVRDLTQLWERELEHDPLPW